MLEISDVLAAIEDGEPLPPQAELYVILTKAACTIDRLTRTNRDLRIDAEDHIIQTMYQ
jgi:hypothetical protein